MYREYLKKTVNQRQDVETASTTTVGLPQPPEKLSEEGKNNPGELSQLPKKPAEESKINSSSPSDVSQLTEEEKKKRLEANKKMLEDMKKEADDLHRLILESMTMLENSVKKDAAIQGDVSKKFPSPAKIIRIFTSSTFTDTKHERNRMMEKTFPNLKTYCQQNGYEFQIVDMRWGIRDEASNDHMTTEICLQELENCQKYSAGVNFLSLLSHKYGYRSLPRQILSDEYEKIYKYVDSSDQRQLLFKWYVKDENAVPAKHILQPISFHLPDYIIQGDQEKQTTAKKTWWKESDSIFQALVGAADKALSPEGAYKFKVSVTHTEVIHGILNKDEKAVNKCVWFQRNIEDIEKQEPSNQLSRFMECMESPEKLKIVKDLICDLKSNMTEKLPPDNILPYSIHWQEKGIDPSNKRHNEYLDKIALDAEVMLKKMIDPIIKASQKKAKASVRDESIQHLLFCQAKCEDFQGKKDILEKVESYMKSNLKHPLVIHGESGSGKTSLMAMIAKQSFQWFEEKATVVLRFCGTTPKSSNLLDLLLSLIEQIRLAQQLTPIYPKGIQEVELAFNGTINSLKQPLVIILDSLDQLDTTYNARTVAWVPSVLRPNVKFVVSTLEDSKYEAFPNLKSKIPHKGLLPVDTISKDDVIMILNHWLKKKERKLTATQKSLLLASYNQCPLPLYLNLCFLEASKWTSYMDMTNIQMYNTVREAINGLFAKLERSHGQIFVSKALGYLTAARIGLTETELEDILSCDDEVLNDVYVYWTPPIRRLPPLLLVRLRHDLQQYLVERGADNVTVIYWYHRQFIEAAQERYCSEETSLKSLHSNLADFFNGTWAGVKKPFFDRNGKSGSEDRHVVAQPIKFGDVYNARKLNNLPFHLSKASRMQELKDKCLLNLEFLNSKLDCSSYRAVVEDYDVAMKISNDQDLSMILKALHLSGDALLYNSREFAPQMILRLADVEALKDFTDKCKQTKTPYLLPNSQVLVKVGGPLKYALAGHRSEVDWVDIKRNGKTAVTACNEDHTIGIWDIIEGRPIILLERISKEPCEVYFAADDSVIFIFESKKYRAITELGEKLWEFPHTTVNCYCICGKSKEILVCFTKTRKVHLYDIKTGEKTAEIDPAAFEENKTHSKIKFGLFCSGSIDFAVCLDSDGLKIWVVDILKKKIYVSEKFVFPVTPELEEEEDEVEIDAIAVTNDGKYIVVSNIYNNIPYLLDIRTFEICKSLPGNKDDVLQEYKLSIDGKKLYGASSGDVVVIDVETGKRERVLHHNKSITASVSVDMVTFLTVSGDSVLRVWDTSRSLSLEVANDRLIHILFCDVLPDGRHALLQTKSDNKDKNKLIVYDTVDNKIVKEAYMTKADLKSAIFLDNSKVLTLVRHSNSAADIHLIDLNLMTENPLQGKIFEDCTNLIKTNYGKEFLVPTRSGKNLKFYDMQTLRATEILKLPENLRKVSHQSATNNDGTMIAYLIDDGKEIVVIDAVTKKIVKILQCKDLNVEEFIEFVIPDNKSYIGIMVYKVCSIDTSLFLYDFKSDKIRGDLIDLEYQKKYKALKSDDSVGMSSACLLDDERILSSHDDIYLRLWKTTTGQMLKRIEGHRVSFSHIYYVPHSPYVVTYGISEEETLHLWDKKTMEHVTSFKLDENVKALKWCADGKSFVSYTSKPANVTRWTILGIDQTPETSKYDQTIWQENNSLTDNLPFLDIKEVERDPTDIDQEEKLPESDDEDDEDEED